MIALSVDRSRTFPLLSKFASAGHPEPLHHSLRRSIDLNSISAGALVATLHRLTGATPKSSVRGAALVHLSEANVTWHRWVNGDADTVQRLAVNCALKDMIWATAVGAGQNEAGVPAVDCEVVFHIGAAEGATPLHLGLPVSHCERQAGFGVWALSGQGVGVAFPDGTAEAELVLTNGDGLVTDAQALVIERDKLAWNNKTEPVIIVEVRWHRLIRAGDWR